MNNDAFTLIEQRNIVQLRLQINRRLFVEQLSEEQTSFPRSQAFKIIAQPSTQAWLTKVSEKLFGFDLPNLITLGGWVARYLKRQNANN